MNERLTPHRIGLIRMDLESQRQRGDEYITMTFSDAEKFIKMAEENERLRAGKFTRDEWQNLCHDMHESGTPCNLQEFAEGCEMFQIHLYGENATANLRQENERLRAALGAIMAIVNRSASLDSDFAHIAEAVREALR